MIGQYSNDEFLQMYKSSQNFKTMISPDTAVIRYGKNTYNYYTQHEDYSWSNYDCITDYSPF